jgi:chromosome segregation ATPase
MKSRFANGPIGSLPYSLLTQKQHKTVSVDSIQSLAGWEGVSSALEEIRDCHAETWAFFHGIFEDLNLFSISLDAHKRHLVQTISTEEAKQDAESAGFSDRLGQLLSQTETDREEIRATREAIQEQVSHLTAVAAELASAQNAFQTNFELIREELAKNREAAAQDAAVSAVSNNVSNNELEQKLTDLEREHSALEQDRAVLEKELEGVRNRAAELAESLAEQKRLAAQQQSQGNAELQRMRQLLETIAKQNREVESSVSSAESAVPLASKSEAPAAASDPVLGSVLAQFEMLQQDRARRRA